MPVLRELTLTSCQESSLPIMLSPLVPSGMQLQNCTSSMSDALAKSRPIVAYLLMLSRTVRTINRTGESWTRI